MKDCFHDLPWSPSDIVSGSGCGFRVWGLGLIATLTVCMFHARFGG